MNDRPSDGTALLVCDQGFAARLLLRTDVLPTLQAAGMRVVALVPNPDEQYLREEMDRRGVRLEQLQVDASSPRSSRRWWLLYNLRLATLAHGDQSRALTEKRRNLPRWAAALTWLLARSRRLRLALVAAETAVTPAPHAELFARLDPDLVITTSPGWFLPDAVVLREAARRAIPTAVAVLSWDNPTSKGYRGALPDRIAAWSARMAEQLVRHHDLPAERIAVAGVPHFDPYLREDGLPSREELCALLELDPARRIVVYATASPGTFDDNQRIAETLADAVEDGSLPDTQLVVRLHPNVLHPSYIRPLEDWRALAATHEHVHLDVPEVRSQRLRCDAPASDTARAQALVRHCDVLVNMFSTTTLEGLLAGRPVVLVTSTAHRDGAGVSPWLAYEHVRAVVRSAAVRVAASRAQLIEEVSAALAAPARGDGAGALVAAAELGPLDGRSGERVAHVLLGRGQPQEPWAASGSASAQPASGRP
jgi:hypothetical protein